MIRRIFHRLASGSVRVKPCSVAVPGTLQGEVHWGCFSDQGHPFDLGRGPFVSRCQQSQRAGRQGLRKAVCIPEQSAIT